MDSAQQRRIAENEARFRAVNEDLVASQLAFRGEADTITIMCECAVTECMDMIDVPMPDYRDARSAGRRFVVRPDHVLGAAEEPFRKADRFWIIEKTGEGARHAEELA